MWLGDSLGLSHEKVKILENNSDKSDLFFGTRGGHFSEMIDIVIKNPVLHKKAMEYLFKKRKADDMNGLNRAPFSKTSTSPKGMRKVNPFAIHRNNEHYQRGNAFASVVKLREHTPQKGITVVSLNPFVKEEKIVSENQNAVLNTSNELYEKQKKQSKKFLIR